VRFFPSPYYAFAGLASAFPLAASGTNSPEETIGQGMLTLLIKMSKLESKLKRRRMTDLARERSAAENALIFFTKVLDRTLALHVEQDTIRIMCVERVRQRSSEAIGESWARLWLQLRNGVNTCWSAQYHPHKGSAFNSALGSYAEKGSVAVVAAAAAAAAAASSAAQAQLQAQIQAQALAHGIISAAGPAEASQQMVVGRSLLQGPTDISQMSLQPQVFQQIHSHGSPHPSPAKSSVFGRSMHPTLPSKYQDDLDAKRRKLQNRQLTFGRNSEPSRRSGKTRRLDRYALMNAPASLTLAELPCQVWTLDTLSETAQRTRLRLSVNPLGLWHITASHNFRNPYASVSLTTLAEPVRFGATGPRAVVPATTQGRGDSDEALVESNDDSASKLPDSQVDMFERAKRFVAKPEHRLFPQPFRTLAQLRSSLKLLRQLDPAQPKKSTLYLDTVDPSGATPVDPEEGRKRLRQRADLGRLTLYSAIRAVAQAAFYGAVSDHPTTMLPYLVPSTAQSSSGVNGESAKAFSLRWIQATDSSLVPNLAQYAAQPFDALTTGTALKLAIRSLKLAREAMGFNITIPIETEVPQPLRCFLSESASIALEAMKKPEESAHPLGPANVFVPRTLGEVVSSTSNQNGLGNQASMPTGSQPSAVSYHNSAATLLSSRSSFAPSEIQESTVQYLGEGMAASLLPGAMPLSAHVPPIAAAGETIWKLDLERCPIPLLGHGITFSEAFASGHPPSSCFPGPLIGSTVASRTLGVGEVPAIRRFPEAAGGDRKQQEREVIVSGGSIAKRDSDGSVIPSETRRAYMRQVLSPLIFGSGGLTPLLLQGVFLSPLVYAAECAVVRFDLTPAVLKLTATHFSLELMSTEGALQQARAYTLILALLQPPPRRTRAELLSEAKARLHNPGLRRSRPTQPTNTGTMWNRAAVSRPRETLYEAFTRIDRTLKNHLERGVEVRQARAFLAAADPTILLEARTIVQNLIHQATLLSHRLAGHTCGESCMCPAGRPMETWHNYGLESLEGECTASSCSCPASLFFTSKSVWSQEALVIWLRTLRRWLRSETKTTHFLEVELDHTIRMFAQFENQQHNVSPATGISAFVPLARRIVTTHRSRKPLAQNGKLTRLLKELHGLLPSAEPRSGAATATLPWFATAHSHASSAAAMAYRLLPSLPRSIRKLIENEKASEPILDLLRKEVRRERRAQRLEAETNRKSALTSGAHMIPVFVPAQRPAVPSTPIPSKVSSRHEALEDRNVTPRKDSAAQSAEAVSPEPLAIQVDVPETLPSSPNLRSISGSSGVDPSGFYSDNESDESEIFSPFTPIAKPDPPVLSTLESRADHSSPPHRREETASAALEVQTPDVVPSRSTESDQQHLTSDHDNKRPSKERLLSVIQALRSATFTQARRRRALLMPYTASLYAVHGRDLQGSPSAVDTAIMLTKQELSPYYAALSFLLQPLRVRQRAARRRLVRSQTRASDRSRRLPLRRRHVASHRRHSSRVEHSHPARLGPTELSRSTNTSVRSRQDFELATALQLRRWGGPTGAPMKTSIAFGAQFNPAICADSLGAAPPQLHLPRAQEWPLSMINAVQPRHYQLQPTALEIFFIEGNASVFLQFPSKSSRDRVFELLQRAIRARHMQLERAAQAAGISAAPAAVDASALPIVIPSASSLTGSLSTAMYSQPVASSSASFDEASGHGGNSPPLPLQQLGFSMVLSNGTWTQLASAPAQSLLASGPVATSLAPNAVDVTAAAFPRLAALGGSPSSTYAWSAAPSGLASALSGSLNRYAKLIATTPGLARVLAATAPSSFATSLSPSQLEEIPLCSESGPGPFSVAASIASPSTAAWLALLASPGWFVTPTTNATTGASRNSTKLMPSRMRLSPMAALLAGVGLGGTGGAPYLVPSISPLTGVAHFEHISDIIMGASLRSSRFSPAYPSVQARACAFASPDEDPVVALQRSGLTNLWRNRDLSNFDYLMALNTVAGRTYADLAQYPVMPWVLSDYESATISLDNPQRYSVTFRDLSKPIGALNPERLAQFLDRAESLAGDAENPWFLYGTHYSSSGTVLFYLLRVAPYTAHALALQDGHVDHGDRLFHSIPHTWRGVLTNQADVKELIPEFFFLSSLLRNTNRLDLGFRQQTEVRIDDVALPRWALGSPEHFIRINRQALESDYVTANLHKWIDLIFGEKQQGAAAERANNVFFHLTYRGAVDVVELARKGQHDATLAQIEYFGQTPIQLFTAPHPEALPLVTLDSVYPRRKFLKNFFLELWKVEYLARRNDPLVFLAHLGDSLVSIAASRDVAVHRWQDESHIPPFHLTPEYVLLGDSMSLGASQQVIQVNQEKQGLFANSVAPVPSSYVGDVGGKSSSSTQVILAGPATGSRLVAALRNGKRLPSRPLLGGVPFAPRVPISANLFVVTHHGLSIISGGHWDGSLRVTNLAQPLVASKRGPTQGSAGSSDASAPGSNASQGSVSAPLGGSFAGIESDRISGRVSIWNVATGPGSPAPRPGRLVQTILHHSAPVSAVALSENGKVFASGSQDGQIAVWLVGTGAHAYIPWNAAGGSSSSRDSASASAVGAAAPASSTTLTASLPSTSTPSQQSVGDGGGLLPFDALELAKAAVLADRAQNQEMVASANAVVANAVSVVTSLARTDPQPSLASLASAGLSSLASSPQGTTMTPTGGGIHQGQLPDFQLAETERPLPSTLGSPAVIQLGTGGRRRSEEFSSISESLQECETEPDATETLVQDEADSPRHEQSVDLTPTSTISSTTSAAHHQQAGETQSASTARMHNSVQSPSPLLPTQALRTTLTPTELPQSTKHAMKRDVVVSNQLAQAASANAVAAAASLTGQAPTSKRSSSSRLRTIGHRNYGAALFGATRLGPSSDISPVADAANRYASKALTMAGFVPPGLLVPVPVLTLSGVHDAPITCLAIHSDLDVIISCAADGSCAIHSLTSGAFIRSFFVGYTASPVSWVAVTDDGVIVLYSASDQTIYSRSLNGDERGMHWRNEPLSAFALSTDGTYLLAGGTAGDLYIFETDSLRLANAVRVAGATQQNEGGEQSVPQDVRITSITVSRSDSEIIIGLSNGQVAIYGRQWGYLQRRFLQRFNMMGF